MEKLLTRFDEEKAAADKRAEAQTAFNTQVSHELQSLTKQIGLTQADVDEVRKVTSPSASSAQSQVEDPAGTPGRISTLQAGNPPPVQTALHTHQPPPHTAPPPSALPIPQVIAGNLPVARLANEGPPLLSNPGQPTAPPPQPVHTILPPPPREEAYTKPPKHNFKEVHGSFRRGVPRVCGLCRQNHRKTCECTQNGGAPFISVG